MKTVLLSTTVLLLLGFLFLGVMSRPQPSQEVLCSELYEQFYKISTQHDEGLLPIFSNMRCPGDFDEDDPHRIVRRKAKEMSNYGDYANAAIAMNEILKESPDDLMFPYYLGRTYLKLNQLDSAQIQFEHMQRYPNSLHYEESQWFYALTLLKQQDMLGCKSLVAQICKTKNHYYRDEAVLLSEEIKKAIRYSIFPAHNRLDPEPLPL